MISNSLIYPWLFTNFRNLENQMNADGSMHSLCMRKIGSLNNSDIHQKSSLSIEGQSSILSPKKFFNKYPNSQHYKGIMDQKQKNLDNIDYSQHLIPFNSDNDLLNNGPSSNPGSPSYIQNNFLAEQNKDLKRNLKSQGKDLVSTKKTIFSNNDNSAFSKSSNEDIFSVGVGKNNNIRVNQFKNKDLSKVNKNATCSEFTKGIVSIENCSRTAKSKRIPLQTKDNYKR